MAEALLEYETLDLTQIEAVMKGEPIRQDEDEAEPPTPPATRIRRKSRRRDDPFGHWSSPTSDRLLPSTYLRSVVKVARGRGPDPIPAVHVSNL